MKYLATILISSFIFSISAKQSLAIYDPRTVPNNLYGLHILDPNEISSVPSFVNNNGGDWGYVTVPIQPSDRDKLKWQTFMENATRLHLIPIVRITTIPLGGTWGEAKDTDLVDFANFLNELSWPIQNRYVVLFNEVNRSTEWGDKVDPSAYTKIVKNASFIFKERSQDFFLLGPALDNGLANTESSLSTSSYLQAMEKADPQIWQYFDGWSSHGYPNPGFIASPTKSGWQSIVSYRNEMARSKRLDIPVFITETGWDQTKLSKATIHSYWSQAYKIWDNDPNVVAVTPFILQGGDQFSSLSFTSPDGKLNPTAEQLLSAPKSPGSPKLADPKIPSASKKSLYSDSESSLPSGFSYPNILLKIENIFRLLLGQRKKAYISLGGKNLTVELATTPKYWERGLSGHEPLAENEGMLFIFPYSHTPSFWMKEMLFSIDIIWLHDSEIVSIEKNLPLPTNGSLPTYSPDSPVDMVLETRAGYSDQHGLKLGDKLVIYD